VSQAYTVTHMLMTDVEQSYPLLCGAAPSATLAKWRQFCAQHRHAGHTLLIARNANQYVQGLCAYFEIEHLSRGRLIEVPLFLVATAVDPKGVADELVRALKQTCRGRRCAAVRILIPPQGWTDANLLSSGERGGDNAIYFAEVAPSSG
jgi:hypothetical protein